MAASSRPGQGPRPRPLLVADTGGPVGSVGPEAGAKADVVAQDRARWVELDWPAPSAMAAFMSLLRTHQEIVSAAHAALPDGDMSITEYAALVAIAMAPDQRQPLGKIAERLMIGNGRCSYLIDRLEKRRWVKRQPHPVDGRTTLACLTKSGIKAVNEATEALATANFGFGDVGDETLESVVECLAQARPAVAPRSRRAQRQA